MGSIDGTIGRFGDISKKLEDSARLQNEVIINFEKSVNSTSELVDKFERILPSMVNISRDLAVSAERLEKLPDALQGLSKLQEEFTSVAKESVALMCTNWKEERERLTSLVEELQKQFSSFEKGIVNGIQTSMSKFDDELSRAGTYVTTWLDRLNDDVTKFTAQIGIFNGAVQNNTSELQKTLNEFNATITNQFIELNTQMTSTNTALRTSFQEIEQGFNRLPTEIDRAVGGVENVYRKATEQLPSMLASHLKEISDEMNKNTRKGFRLFGR
jgi:methyl-accepting chemotaxis protein